MTACSDLLLQLHREMLASERGWSSEEIARAALKLTAVGKSLDRIVEALLLPDSRFDRRGPLWFARATRAPRLQELGFLLVEALAPPAGSRERVLFALPFDPPRPPSHDPIRLDPGAGMQEIWREIEGRILATLDPAPARRQLHLLERSCALPELPDPLLDLRRFHAGTSTPRRREEEGVGHSPAERLEATRSALERLLDVWGERTLEEVERELQGTDGATEVDFSPFRFGRELLGLLPTRPGIYRFLGDGGRLLYVGKARDLRRRVTSHFRPLAPEHQRRAALLREVRDLACEESPSELEAILMEAEAIRRERPEHNVQVALQGDAPPLRAVDRDALLVACDGDPEEVSVFLISDGLPWARARIPRSEDQGSAELAGRIARLWWSGPASPPTEILSPIEAPEAILVLRYAHLEGDRCDRLRREDLAGAEGAAEALASLACRPRPAWEPWIVRRR